MEAADRQLCTPLHLAVLQGREEAVDVLLRNGASVTAVDEDFNTPLHFAAAEGHRRIASALIRVRAPLTPALRKKRKKRKKETKEIMMFLHEDDHNFHARASLCCFSRS